MNLTENFIAHHDSCEEIVVAIFVCPSKDCIRDYAVNAELVLDVPPEHNKFVCACGEICKYKGISNICLSHPIWH